MTAEERYAYLVRLAMEAWDTIPYSTVERDRFERAARERMAQAAQVWTSEVDQMQEQVDQMQERLRGAYRAARIGCHSERCSVPEEIEWRVALGIKPRNVDE